MSRGKYQKKRKIAVLPWVLLSLALLSLTFGGTVAYLSASTPPVANKFTAATSGSPIIEETFENNVKSNVSVNVGNPGYAVYVRAAVVVTWQDSSGNVYWKAPVEDTDYAVTMNETDWFLNGDFWYYRYPITEGNTKNLITTCTPLTAAPAEGYTLSVEIIAQTVQAVGGTDDGDIPAVKNAWGIDTSSFGDS